jgi:hypothetical protein
MISSHSPTVFVAPPRRRTIDAIRQGLGRSRCCVFLLLAAWLAGAAQASVITGTNAALQAAHGKFLIPLKAEDSGTLGDPWPNNPRKHIGRNADKVRLAQGQGSTGSLSFILDFDLTGQIPEGQTIEQDSATILLNLYDVDLRHVVNRMREFWETMDVTFMNMDDPVGAPGLFTLHITKDNYGDFGDFPAGGANLTDRKTVTYSFNLADDLQVAPADFDQIVQDGGFRLQLAFTANIDRIGRGRGSYINTKEALTNTFQFVEVAVPEPAVITLLGVGAVALLRRRRTRTGR